MNKRKPNLICPGAQKSGTTTLFHVIKQHPDIFAPEFKEPHYFNINYESGIDFYMEYYKDVADEKYIADNSPFYMPLDFVPERIRETLGPDVKFIFMLRNPVDRAYSAYWMQRMDLSEEFDNIEDALKAEPGRINKSIKFFRYYSYAERGYYAKQIKKFMEYFPKENMYFVIFEEFIKDIEVHSKKIFEFLGIETNVSIDYDIWSNRQHSVKNPGLVKIFRFIKKGHKENVLKLFSEKNKRKMKHLVRKYIYRRNSGVVKYEKNRESCNRMMKIFIDDINELEKILDRDLSLWKEKYSEDE